MLTQEQVNESIDLLVEATGNMDKGLIDAGFNANDVRELIYNVLELLFSWRLAQIYLWGKSEEPDAEETLKRLEDFTYYVRHEVIARAQENTARFEELLERMLATEAGQHLRPDVDGTKTSDTDITGE